ncbi:uncharacterized protein LOC131459140 isoform X3 [Solea solea]|uniref:uncharacterized protein LOC131459140 isoform X3 n=1 Tax=Solea solea TaxID=90069 RepID=UPI00272B64FD|nr:uncharacterized protein LOC131459140 isoform X3 [Solea solea]
MSMEGDPEGSVEELWGSTVLWKKCIQQTIFVDLSEDESLHLSDLEGSLGLHLSQAESAGSDASVHLSGSAELSALDDTSSESRNVTSPNERVLEKNTSILSVSVQRPHTMQNAPLSKRRNEDSGQNTSDEDQDDLPYDGDLGSLYFNQTPSTEANTSSDGRETLHESPDDAGLLELTTKDRDDTSKHLVLDEHTAEEPASLSQEDDAPMPSDVAALCSHPAHIQKLLQNFSQLDLVLSGRLIEAETLPEVSLLESMDSTILSLATTHNSTHNTNGNHSDNITLSKSESHSGGTDDKSHAVSENTSLHEETERNMNVISAADSVASSIDSNQSSRDNSVIDVVKQEESDDRDQLQRNPLVRARSFSEIKYGQGQIHYPLPDFSKVAPKVKIPKAPSGPSRPVPQYLSTMHRAQSSPMLDVISRVLEDSGQPPEKPYVFRDEEKQTPPALVHQLQAEYDKLLTKYAGAENLIDQLRLGISTQPFSDPKLYSEHDGDPPRNLAEGSHLGSLAPQRSPSKNFVQKGGTRIQSDIKGEAFSCLGQPEKGPSEGERMTAELRDIIGPFIQKVEGFKMSVSDISMSTEEQQMMLRSMMEAQDQLERKYISKKEEHRAMEMQNYRGLSRNTGIFDPNRLIEGDIFRIGMHLDDIKETIDKNMCELISPPRSSSTPTPMKERLHVSPSPLCTLIPSPPPSLHQGPHADFSTVVYKMETCKKELKADEVEQASEEVERSRDAVLDTGHKSCTSWGTRESLERLDNQRAEAEDGNEEESTTVLSEGSVHHRDILACLSGISLSSAQTHESHSAVDRVRVAEGKCDLGDCVSLTVEVSTSCEAPKPSDTHSHTEPPLNTSGSSQRTVSPQADSGFGSSYLTQSASGSFQPNLLIERYMNYVNAEAVTDPRDSEEQHYLGLSNSSAQSHEDGLSSSESEGCSKLQTTIYSASLNTQRWANSHPSVQTQSCGQVELWVESTTKEPSLGLQGSDRSLPSQHSHYVSEPALSTTMNSLERGSQVYSCSCNRSVFPHSEAILALQSEVSRLKKELEEGLVQLPHLAQKMDYLTSKYRQDRQERRSKTRQRTHLKPSRHSPARVEDWISSDMDPSKSKGTESGDTAASEVMLQFHNSPVESRRGRSFQSGQGKLQSSRGAEGNRLVKTHVITCSSFKGEKGGATDSAAPQTAMIESFYSKERWSPLSSPSLQKPLLQVNYCSSSSLPASYKVREPLLQSMSRHRKRSTQSDTALLPSNVYFQRTLSPVSVSSKSVNRTGRRSGSKDEDMNRSLDKAIEVARSMKRTTDRMAKKLSADLAKAELHRKLHCTQTLEGRKQI